MSDDTTKQSITELVLCVIIFRTNREQEESSMEKSTIQTLRNHIKENLQDIFSLVILLESDMAQQKEDEVYTRIMKIIREKIKASLSDLDSQQD